MEEWTELLTFGNFVGTTDLGLYIYFCLGINTVCSSVIKIINFPFSLSLSLFYCSENTNDWDVTVNVCRKNSLCVCVFLRVCKLKSTAPKFETDQRMEI